MGNKFDFSYSPLSKDAIASMTEDDISLSMRRFKRLIKEAKNSGKDSTPYEAANSAYCTILKPHLPWPMQKLGQASLRFTKQMRKETIFAKIGGFQEEKYGEGEYVMTKKELSQLVESWNPMLYRWNTIYEEMGWGGL